MEQAFRPAVRCIKNCRLQPPRYKLAETPRKAEAVQRRKGDGGLAAGAVGTVDKFPVLLFFEPKRRPAHKFAFPPVPFASVIPTAAPREFFSIRNLWRGAEGSRRSILYHALRVPCRATVTLRKCVQVALTIESGIQLAVFALTEVSLYDTVVNGEAQVYILRPNSPVEELTGELGTQIEWAKATGDRIRDMIVSPMKPDLDT